MARKERLSPEIFNIPVEKIRRGYYSAVYFWREKRILEELAYNKKVLLQVFQKKDAVLCGTDEVIAVLRYCSGHWKDFASCSRYFDEYLETEREVRALRNGSHANQAKLRDKRKALAELEVELEDLWVYAFAELNVKTIYDGDKVSPWETVMTVEGLPQHFAHLESLYLGILARRTLVATNVARVVEAAHGKPILFFADRFDHYENQTGDGYAAAIGGAAGIATDTMGEWWGTKGMGTIPHALIACFYGNTAEATLAFAKKYPKVPCIALVDFANDCVRTSIEVASRFKTEGLKLYGVRLDTAEMMVDRSITRCGQLGEEKPTGVTPTLVRNVRFALDRNGYAEIKIVVSGGFNREKIGYFEKVGVPVDVYGCGSSLLKGENDFTADIVAVDGRPCAKAGRWLRPNPRLELVL